MHRYVRALCAGIDDDGHAPRHLVDDDPGDLPAFRLRQLVDFAPQSDAQPVNAGIEIELDQAAQAVLVDP